MSHVVSNAGRHARKQRTTQVCWGYTYVKCRLVCKDNYIVIQFGWHQLVTLQKRDGMLFFVNENLSKHECNKGFPLDSQEKSNTNLKLVRSDIHFPCKRVSKGKELGIYICTHSYLHIFSPVMSFGNTYAVIL